MCVLRRDHSAMLFCDEITAMIFLRQNHSAMGALRQNHFHRRFVAKALLWRFANKSLPSALCGEITSIGALRQKHCCDTLRQNHRYGALRTNHFHGRFAEKSLPQALCGKITAVSLYRKITSIGNLRRNQFHGRFAAKLLPRALCGKITAVALCGVSPRLPVLTA